MKREIRRIDPWSAVRVGFFLGLFCGFVMGLFNSAIIKYLAGVMGNQVLPPDMMSMVNLSIGAIIALSLVMSLICSLLFAISGLVAAVLYNVIAGLFGGLELTLAGDEPGRVSSAGTEPQEPQDE